MENSPERDEIVSSICSLTGVSADEALEYLNLAGFDSDLALGLIYQRQEEEQAEQAEHTAGESTSTSAAAAAPAVEPAYTGPRTLDGRPAPQSQMSSSRSAAQSSKASAQKKKGIMTLGSMGGGHGHDHDHDDEDDDDSDDNDPRGPRDLFAGGEKSGLAVQDPAMGGPAAGARKVIRDIFAKARGNQASAAGEASTVPQAPSRFRGSGVTLGGEGAESRVIPDTTAGGQRGPSDALAAGDDVQERTLHIWQDGFSVEDGPLHRFDDPRNAADLQVIQQGRVPLHLMNVRPHQAVDAKLNKHEENWHQLPRVYRPFSGEGRRLGSPLPGAPALTTAPLTVVSPTAATAATTAGTSSTATPTVDESQPTLSIRVQLPDGTRLPARFNTTQTVGDVYEFVQRAIAASAAGREWVLMTTFPNKEHTDRGLVLGEMAEFKRGGAAVVKWA